MLGLEWNAYLVEVVIDVFADDVDSAGTARYECRCVIVNTCEFGTKRVPSLGLRW